MNKQKVLDAIKELGAMADETNPSKAKLIASLMTIAGELDGANDEEATVDIFETMPPNLRMVCLSGMVAVMVQVAQE